MIERKSTWQLRALCRGLDMPKNIGFCKGCPVIDPCRSYAIAHDEFGIWGGTSRNQRLKLDPMYTNLIRQLYLEAGLLEWRPSLESAQEPQEEQQLELFDPTVLMEVS